MSEKDTFDLINREIDRLFDRLEKKGVCPCCAAMGLLYRGSGLYKDVVGGEEAASVCQEIADSICDVDDIAAPTGDTQH